LREETTDHWYEIFDEAGVWYAPVNDYADIEDDPQLEANGSILTFEHPRAGTVRLLSHPIRYDEETPALRRIPPRLGEHTEEVLSEAGYGAEAISNLVEAGVVRAAGRDQRG
jgi:crotonobetainyl-CoA:carnitine CoA-transferase CaiB-like acyl-CoA transferase